MQLRSEGGLPTVFGHRGMSTRARENTLAAFGLVVQGGVSGIELDIHQCATGELMVFHDDTLSRIAGVDLKIREAGCSIVRRSSSRFTPMLLRALCVDRRLKAVKSCHGPLQSRKKLADCRRRALTG